MKLKFDQITKKVNRFELPAGSWRTPESSEFQITADAAIKVRRQDEQAVVFEGLLDGYFLSLCDRCGNSVKDTFRCCFNYLLTTRQEMVLEVEEVELSNDEAMTLYLEEPEIDVDQILREQSYLERPLRTLCREDCKGICISCGADLNKEICSCADDNDDSPFAVLKKLKKT